MDQQSIQRLAVRPEEAAKMIGVCANTLRKLLYTGEIKGKQVGKRWVVPIKAINEYLERES